MSSIKPRFLYQLGVSFLFSATPLLVFPYLTRVLGPENIGKVNFVDYTAQVFIVFSSFGIPMYGVREIAKAKHDTKNLTQVTSELVLLHILITLLGLLFFLMLIVLQRNHFLESELIILASVNLILNALGLEWFIHGMEDFKFLAKRSFLIKVVSVVVIFLLVRRSDDYICYYFILVATNVLMLIIDLSYVLKRRAIQFKSLHLNQHLKPLTFFFLTTVTLSIYTFFDTVILGLVAGTLAVGFYTTALKIIRVSHTFINDLGGVLVPRISVLIQNMNLSEIERLLNKSLDFILTTTLPFCTFLFLSASEIIFVLAGRKFGMSTDVLRILSFLPLIIGLGNLFFIQILIPFRKEKQIMIGVILGCVVSLSFNFMLCPFFKEKGAAIACMAAELIVTAYLGMHSMKNVRLLFNRKTVVGTLITSLCFIPLVYLARISFQSPILILFISSSLCLFTFLMLKLYVFKSKIIWEAVDFLKNHLIKSNLNT